MLVKIREDYAGLSQPWTALLDTVRFSLVSKTPDQHASFVHRFPPEGVEVGGSGGGAGEDEGGAAAPPPGRRWFGPRARWMPQMRL